ncbi:MAG: glutamate--tRNA ligase [Candidatus Gracilibacteria bacterium]|nr:glutamate--tRNA ligase [Candidatus Gracilibacteria bacterium]
MLENLLFPEIKETPDNIIAKYPKRNSDLVVTRMAPSPTGFLHIGAVYSTILDTIVAKKNNGVVFLRIEDTDQKREIEGAAEKFVDIFKIFGLNFDEGPVGENYADIGNYGPYTQSKREYIYKVFIKDLVEKGLAYPCFLTEEEISETRAIQEASKVPTGIYNEYSPWRFASIDDVKQALIEKKEFVIRLRSTGEITKKIDVKDIIKGTVSTQENFLDIVICKKSGIPTYHFAHLIDDYLMGTTHVIRGDEWFASLPLHLELFKTMGWNSPKYAHYGPLVKIDGDAKRKLSKRKDKEADVEFYFSEGYLFESIIDFLSNIINAGFEDWRKQNLTASFLDFDFKLERVNTSGALVDIDKLNWVNSNIIKNIDTNLLYDKLISYFEKYDTDFLNIISKFTLDYNLKVLNELKTKIRKFNEFKDNSIFFYNDSKIPSKDLLINTKMKIDSIDTVKKGIEISIKLLESTKNDFSSIEEVKEAFVAKIIEAEMKNGQVLWPVRCALSGEEFSPGALEMVYILGLEKSIFRLKNVLSSLV